MLFKKTTLILPIICLTLISFLNFFNYKYWIGFLIIFLIVLFFNFLNFQDTKRLQDLVIENKDAKIIKVFASKTLVNINNQNVLVDFKIKIDESFSHLNFLKISAKITKIKEVNNFSLANNFYLEILKNNIKEIKILKRATFINLFYENKDTKEFLNLILFNIANKNSDLYLSLSKLNISHLFTISGFHFGLIFLILNFILKKLKFNKFFIFLITEIILFYYLYLLNFSLSALRALIFLNSFYIFKNFLKIKIKTINIFLLNTFVFIVLNLNIIYNLTFILSFGITFNIFY
nr:ComEC/Rec2 family competence protein [Mycoplasma struthionis]